MPNNLAAYKPGLHMKPVARSLSCAMRVEYLTLRLGKTAANTLFALLFPHKTPGNWIALLHPGLYLAVPGISFGLGFGLGFFGGYGWGWHHWGFDWGHRAVIFNHTTYISHSRTFINRNNLGRGGRPGFGRPGGFRGAPARGFAGAQHGAGALPGQFGSHSSAFSGFNHGGVARGDSFRGRSSFGGLHGSGGFHGGGGSHGGGRR